MPVRCFLGFRSTATAPLGRFLRKPITKRRCLASFRIHDGAASGGHPAT